jgi:hypothetical protein
MPNFVIKVYITEYKDGVFEQGTTITSFPESPTQMSDIYTFLKDIYDEFRRLGLYESSILVYLQRRKYEEYEFLDDSAEDHRFRDGPLPGGNTFNILETSIRKGYVRRGYTLFLTDVCEGNNIFNQWALFLEVV